MNDTPKFDSSHTSVVDVVTHEKSSSKNSTKKSAREQMVGSLNIIYVVLIILALLLFVQWWNSTNQINQLREELARRLQATDVSTSETKALTKSFLETDKQVQVKLGVLERKQTESESHALALQQLYQELSKNRDDWALSEIEQVLSIASQQLQLAGNVQGALIALQNADARLARSDKPQFITIRRSIARDIDRLKALPSLDLPGIALHLDNAIAQVETMPLLINEHPADLANPNSPKPTAAKKASAKVAAPKEKTPTADEPTGWKAWKEWLSQHWQIWSTEMGKELHQLVRIRKVDNPDALLLTPSQAYFARENVKLRLLNARLALLSRNETVFKNDLIMAQKEIALYFDTRAKQTQAIQALLRQIQNSKISIEMPSLADSLNAVRNFTVKQ